MINQISIFFWEEKVVASKTAQENEKMNNCIAYLIWLKYKFKFYRI
jgi:hypothetical protein